MGAAQVPASMAEALGVLESVLGYIAGADPAELPEETIAQCLRGPERAAALTAVARGRMLAAFDARDGHTGDGQRTAKAWLVHTLGVTPGQAAAYLAEAKLARDHAVCSRSAVSASGSPPRMS